MSFAEIYTAENNSESVLELSRLVNNLEIENKEEQLERLRAKNTLILIIIAIVIIFIIFGLYIYNSYRRLQDEKAKQEINNKNETIKIQKLQQYQEQQNRTQLINELNAAVNDTNNQQMRSSIRMIINRLNKGGDVSGDWVEVEKMFTSGNDTFFENLLKEYPNLTKNERKLCTFIHMNLSTKEISKITHQSVGSINIARSRLRQKFGISGDEQSLIAFLDKFAAPNN
jgi:DNA-binding CsgD family transcriptional regulator